MDLFWISPVGRRSGMEGARRRRKAGAGDARRRLRGMGVNGRQNAVLREEQVRESGNLAGACSWRYGENGCKHRASKDLGGVERYEPGNLLLSARRRGPATGD